jgi:hypothetical protein
VSEVPPFAIGAKDWPGLAKLAEECGELIQVIGKLMAYPDGDHPDGGPNLIVRLSDEIADVRAACTYVVLQSLDSATIEPRVQFKLRRFLRWDEEERRA